LTNKQNYDIIKIQKERKEMTKMKIIDNYTEKKGLTFEDLEVGDVFIDKDDDVCMKVDTSQSANTVLLENGDVVTTVRLSKVTRVNATLTIEREE
jgi:ribosomal protein S4E